MKHLRLRTPRFRSILATVLVGTLLVGTLLAMGCLPIGPISLISGGRLRGTVYDGPEPDWAPFAELRIVELQVDPVSPRSVHVGFFVHESQPYVSATLRPNEKRWPRSIAADPHVVLRIEGVLYPRLARRVNDEVRRDALLEAGRQKFDPSFFEADRTWFYELRPGKAQE